MYEKSAAFEELLKALLAGMPDLRVARALGARWPEREGPPEPGEVRIEGGLSGGLLEAIDAQWLPRFREMLGDDAEEFGELPDDARLPAVAIGWVRDERPQFADRARNALAVVVGRFVGDHRESILQAMRDAGEGPDPDRAGRMARAEALLADAAAKVKALEALPAHSTTEAIDEVLDPAVAPLEEAREILQGVALDDGIAGVPEGAVAAGERLRQTYLAEEAAYVDAAGRIGPPLHESPVGTFEQQTYLLDAIVALQEALTLRVELSDLLRLARLRLAKGDVGEARAIVDRLLEMDCPDELRGEAEALREQVGSSSPLGRDKRCFIATAASGEDDPEVQTLRDFRDEVLYPHRAGRAALSLYYRISPPIARAIASSDAARKVVRTLVVHPAATLASRWLGTRGR